MTMIEDIEEIVSLEKREFQSDVAVKNYKSLTIQDQPDAIPDPSFLPGQAQIFVKTWGCGHNNSDGEYMAGLLATQGYHVILEDDQKSNADLWLLNSCTVKGPSEQTFINEIKKAQSNGKKVVVSGCVPQGAPHGWQDFSVVGVQQIDQVVHVVEETLKGNTIRLLKDAKSKGPDGKSRKLGGARLDLPKVRRNPFIEIIPINTGCLNQCTYCKTKHARGDLGSYEPSEIIDRVNSVLSEGVLEIWLTSEDTGAYGRDIGVSIVELLRGIVDAMDAHPNQDAMLRVGMTNPPYILEHLVDIAPILCHPRVYSFLHVPVQAGSNRVLNDMRRLYVREEFEHVVTYLRKHVPGITIATDVICGFPTETEEDFEDTIRLLEEFRFPVLHISQFYPRPGTPAARLQRLPSEVVKTRSRKVTRFFDSYTSYEYLIGQELKVLVTDRGHDGIHFVAHDKFYRPILVPGDDSIMGSWVKVVVERTGKYYIISRVIEKLSLPKSISESKIAEGKSVLKRRMPKLIRGQKGLVKLEDKNQKQETDDGTELSLPASSRVREFQLSRHQPTLLLVSVLSGITLFSKARWSLKLGLTVLTGIIVYSSRNTYRRES